MSNEWSPKVSCIVTSYNNSQFIERTVESLLAQTVAPFEILVADDRSSDDSLMRVRRMAERYPSIRIVQRDENVGVATNRDMAIREARGDVVTTLDGDDIYYPCKIESELVLLKENPEAVIFSDVNWIDAEDVLIRGLRHDHINQFDRPALIDYLIFRRGPIPRDMMFTKELFLRAGGYNRQMAIYEDWDLKIRLAREAKRWLFSGSIGVGYRRHGSGLSYSDGVVHLRWQVTALINNGEWIAEILGPEVLPRSVMQACARSLGAREVKVVK